MGLAAQAILTKLSFDDAVQEPRPPALAWLAILVALVAVGAALRWGAVGAEPTVEFLAGDQAHFRDEPEASPEPQAPETVGPGPERGRTAAPLPDAGVDASMDAAEMDAEHVWLLTFGIRAGWSERPRKVYVRAAGVRCSTVFDPEAELYRADVTGSRRALAAGDLTVVAGRAEIAKFNTIQVNDEEGPHGLGDTSLAAAHWDMERRRIDAGLVTLREPPRLGALVSETPSEIVQSFKVSSDAISDAAWQTVYFSVGAKRIELATFLPAKEWSAEAISSSMGPRVPEWRAVAPTGEEITVPSPKVHGIQVLVALRSLSRIDMVSILALPAPERSVITPKELRESARASALPPDQRQGRKRFRAGQARPASPLRGPRHLHGGSLGAARQAGHDAPPRSGARHGRGRDGRGTH